MARIPSVWLVAAVASAGCIAAVSACGQDDSESRIVPGAHGDAGPVNDATSELIPVAAEHGLDTRPPNPTCVAPPRPSSSTDAAFVPVLENVVFQDGLMAMAMAPGMSDRWFAALRSGLIVSFPALGASGAPGVVADVAALAGSPVQTAGEGGLLGFAFHPKFANNGHLFVSWTTTGGPSDMRSTVGRITSMDGGQSFTNYEAIIPPFDQPASNHNGGGIAFGPDGKLYLGFGDGGGGDDTYLHGQDRTTFFAKILRIDVDDAPPGERYGIPPDNPFAAGGAEPATFAYGLRNPFRFSFDRASGELWAGDVGQNAWEEINTIVPGGNYGWPCREGNHDHLDDPSKCPNPNATFVDPMYEYPHDGSASVTGGVVYRGKALPNLVGHYVFGDYATQQLFTLSFDSTSGEPEVRELNAEGPRAAWSGFAEDLDGEVYALSLFPPKVYQLVAAGEPSNTSVPDRLSQTGCFDPSDPRRPLEGLVPFGVNSPLWSDGAAKERHMAIPDGTTIEIGEDGDFVFPVGTVLTKTFFLEGKRIETRLFVRHDDGDWAGYSYEWDDAQQDATLLPSSKSKQVGSITWSFPSRANCVQCHTQAAGRALGPEVGQLNGDFVYPSTNRQANQLRTLEHIGMLALKSPVEGLVAYPDPASPGPVEPRARSYLHANCSHCHRENGPGRSDIDLRFSLSLEETKTCGTPPQNGDLGIPGATVLSPGNPALSLIVARTRSIGAGRMPPLATTVVDEQGTSLIDSWITAMSACP